MAGSIEMAFGMWDAVFPSNHVLDGGPDLPMVRGNFGGFPPQSKTLGLRAPECSVNDAWLLCIVHAVISS